MLTAPSKLMWTTDVYNNITGLTDDPSSRAEHDRKVRETNTCDVAVTHSPSTLSAATNTITQTRTPLAHQCPTQGRQICAQIGSDWPQMRQILDLFRAEFSTFWLGSRKVLDLSYFGTNLVPQLTTMARASVTDSGCTQRCQVASKWYQTRKI